MTFGPTSAKLESRKKKQGSTVASPPWASTRQQEAEPARRANGNADREQSLRADTPDDAGADLARGDQRRPR